MMALRIAIGVLAATGLLMIAVRLLIWQWRPSTRPCKWFGHDRRYVAIRLSACVRADSPEASGRGFPCDHNHQIGDKDITIARWVCRRCPEMKEECFGRGKDWKIDHERVVPDVKKWANWSQDLPDPSATARQKLKEVQERIAHYKESEGITVKTELAKDKEYCKTCGWCHAGPCNPASELRYCDRCKAEHTGSCPAS